MNLKHKTNNQLIKLITIQLIKTCSLEVTQELSSRITIALAMKHGGELRAAWNLPLTGEAVGRGMWKCVSKFQVHELHRPSAPLAQNAWFYKQNNIKPEESSVMTPLEGKRKFTKLQIKFVWNHENKSKLIWRM